MDQNMPDAEKAEAMKVYSTQLGALMGNFPYVQECIVRVAAIDCDPEPLLALIRKPKNGDPDTPVGEVLTALLSYVETRTNALLAEISEAEDKIQSQADQIRDLKDENNDLKDD